MKDLKIIKTPLVKFNNKQYKWKNILLKDETKQLTGAFKIRGVLNKFITANLKQSHTIVTASTGNHAQAVALCSNYYNKNCIIFVPENIPQCKINKISQYNPTINKQFKDYEECKINAIELSKKSGYYYIPSFDDFDIIEGHKTLFSEIDWKDIDYCFCPVGGGGLISAGLEYLKNMKTKIIGVEIESNDAMKQALEKKKVIKININNQKESFAEGILVSEVGEKNLEIAINNNLEICTVNEEEIKKAIGELSNSNSIKAEGAGAASLACAIKHQKEGKKCICIISGGNIDDKIFNEIIKG